MKITNVENPDIIKGIKNGNDKYYAYASSNNFIHIDLQDEYFVKGIKLCFFIMIIVFILMNVGFQKTIKVGMNYSVILMQLL